VNPSGMERFVVPPEVTRTTRAHLRARAAEGTEGVVLWIGTFDPPRITRAVVPEQETSAGHFRVPLRARQQLTRELVGTGQMVVAQVHSHPMDAFHSCIDDAEAIPRRAGAYSLVLPDFGTRQGLLDDAALFRLDDRGRWLETPLSIFVVRETPPIAETKLTAPVLPKRSLWRQMTDALRSIGRSRT
jgi:hypothetical protein